MSYKANFLFATLCIVSTIYFGHCEVQAVPGSCGLTGIPTDTSTSNLYPLPTISDNLNPDVLVWENGIFGNVRYTSVNPSSDWAYMTAKLQKPTGTYEILTNDKSNLFTKTTGRREMTRYITFNCTDGSMNRYFFKTHVQDMTAPVFQEDEYTFEITSDWDPKRPISEGQFVIVSDNAFELDKEDSLELKFEVSQEDVVTVSPVKLWVPGLVPVEEDYYYRLDIFLDEGKSLISGERIELAVSAKDQFNTGLTKIFINVS